jgi:beta-xylosidase
MKWVDGWPQIGEQSHDLIGEPVPVYKKPHTLIKAPRDNPADSDEFNGATLGLQWQWQANPEPTWGFPSVALGVLRLFSVPPPAGVSSLWETPAVLLQKVPAPVFSATTKLSASFLNVGDRAGIVLMGKSYGYLVLTRTDAGLVVRQVAGSEAGATTKEAVTAEAAVGTTTVYLRMNVVQGLVSFAYSSDGDKFQPIGLSFSATPGVWIGAKIGVFAGGQTEHGEFGYADFDWFHIQGTR